MIKLGFGRGAFEVTGELEDAVRDAQTALAMCFEMGLPAVLASEVVELALTEGVPEYVDGE